MMTPLSTELFNEREEMLEFVLGIESTAHTFGVSIVSSDKKILSNEKIFLKMLVFM